MRARKLDRKKLDEYLKRDYPIELRAIPAELGGGYLATIPYLGRGSFMADGDTAQEALQNLEEVKVERFTEMLEQGEEIPAPPPAPEDEEYSGNILLRIPKWLHASIAQRAKEEDGSINRYITNLLISYVSAKGCAELCAAKVDEAIATAVRDIRVAKVMRTITPYHSEEKSGFAAYRFETSERMGTAEKPKPLAA